MCRGHRSRGALPGTPQTPPASPLRASARSQLTGSAAALRWRWDGPAAEGGGAGTHRNSAHRQAHSPTGAVGPLPFWEHGAHSQKARCASVRRQMARLMAHQMLAGLPACQPALGGRGVCRLGLLSMAAGGWDELTPSQHRDVWPRLRLLLHHVRPLACGKVTQTLSQTPRLKYGGTDADSLGG